MNSPIGPPFVTLVTILLPVLAVTAMSVASFPHFLFFLLRERTSGGCGLTHELPSRAHDFRFLSHPSFHGGFGLALQRL